MQAAVLIGAPRTEFEGPIYIGDNAPSACQFIFDLELLLAIWASDGNRHARLDEKEYATAGLLTIPYRIAALKLSCRGEVTIPADLAWQFPLAGLWPKPQLTP